MIADARSILSHKMGEQESSLPLTDEHLLKGGDTSVARLANTLWVSSAEGSRKQRAKTTTRAAVKPSASPAVMLQYRVT